MRKEVSRVALEYRTSWAQSSGRDPGRCAGLGAGRWRRVGGQPATRAPGNRCDLRSAGRVHRDQYCRFYAHRQSRTRTWDIRDWVPARHRDRIGLHRGRHRDASTNRHEQRVWKCGGPHGRHARCRWDPGRADPRAWRLQFGQLPGGERQPDAGWAGQLQRSVHLSGRLDADHGFRQHHHAYRWRPGLQRLLAGRQFRHPRDGLRPAGNRSGAHQHYG